jgi:pimeloyl-ACP methyl ester carboxylesterase
MRMRLMALLLVLATVLGLQVSEPVAARADVTACASELGLTKPTPADAKAQQPVVLVHGLGSKAETWSEGSPSMRLSLESAAVAVRAFDYERANTDWVTTGDTTHRLAKTVICYQQLYGGKKVIIVAHSMGGLLTRAMMSWAAYGKYAKTAVGHVITIGTPHLGAPMGGYSAFANLSLCKATVVWFGTEAAKDCEVLESSKAISAMSLGSKQLADLPHFPKGISVRAIAGNVRTRLCGLNGCGSEYATSSDLVVPVKSATAEYTTKGTGDGVKVYECFDPIAMPGIRHPWCEHSGMLKSTIVQDDVKASIASLAPTSDQQFTKTIQLDGGLVLPARASWDSPGPTSVLDMSTCKRTAEPDYWKVCAWIYVKPEGDKLKEVRDMLCADKLLETTSTMVGGRAAMRYKYARCDARESTDTSYLWHIPGGIGVEYNVSVDGTPMKGIEDALALATWR